MEKSFLKQLVSSTVFTFTSLSASLPRSSRLKQESCTWSCRLLQLFCYQKCSVTWLWHYTQFCIKVYVAVIPTYHHRSTESCCDYYFNAFSVLKIVLTIFHSEYGQSYHMRTMRIITGYKMWNSGIFCLICHHINKQKKKPQVFPWSEEVWEPICIQHSPIAECIHRMHPSHMEAMACI